MTLTIDNYFAAGWRDAIHTCSACEWSGPLDALDLEPHREQSEYSCPDCECLVLVVAHPDLDQVKAAAADGHPEALEQLALLEAFANRSR